jgi:hypothetical protein
MAIYPATNVWSGRRSACACHQGADAAGQGDDPAWLGGLGAELGLGLVLQPLVGVGLGDGAVAAWSKRRIVMRAWRMLIASIGMVPVGPCAAWGARFMQPMPPITGWV